MIKIDFDSTDKKGMIALMDKYGDTKEAFFGTNELGEFISLEITHNYILVITTQRNGWHRYTTYYREGLVEETYGK